MTYTLTIHSSIGNCYPAPGVHIVEHGSPIHCYVSNAVIFSGTLATQYLCNGYTSPELGSDTAHQYRIHPHKQRGPHLALANQLPTSTSRPPVPVPSQTKQTTSITSPWMQANKTLLLKAIPAPYFSFNEWQGDTNSGIAFFRK